MSKPLSWTMSDNNLPGWAISAVEELERYRDNLIAKEVRLCADLARCQETVERAFESESILRARIEELQATP